MKRVLLIMLILTCALFLFTGCEVENITPEKVGETAESQPSDSGEAENQEQTQPKTDIFKIGDSVKAENLVFTVNSTRTDEGKDFIKPKDGHIFYIVDVTVENTGNESESVSSLMMFKLFDSEGYNYTITIGPETKGSIDGEILAGRKLRGELPFEIPKDATGLELEIDPTFFGSGKIIVELDR